MIIPTRRRPIQGTVSLLNERFCGILIILLHRCYSGADESENLVNETSSQDDEPSLSQTQNDGEVFEFKNFWRKILCYL